MLKNPDQLILAKPSELELLVENQYKVTGSHLQLMIAAEYKLRSEKKG